MSRPVLKGPVPVRARRRRSRRQPQPGPSRLGVCRRLAGPVLGWLLLAAALGSPVPGALFLPTSAAQRT
ncbi:MAG TPA: hypothetical protein VFK80_10905, partial [Limnochordia bacterium]|nr:hypothetical protein [Limnochordia bacterium]